MKTVDKIIDYQEKQANTDKKNFLDGLFTPMMACFIVGLDGVVLFFVLEGGALNILLLLGGIVALGAGVFFFYKWYMHKTKVMSHLHLVRPRGITRLADVAQTRGETIDEAAQCLQELIDRGYFEGIEAYIDYPNQWFVGAPDQTAPVTCPRCGASWVATQGAVDRCPFCGTFLTR